MTDPVFRSTLLPTRLHDAIVDVQTRIAAGIAPREAVADVQQHLVATLSEHERHLVEICTTFLNPAGLGAGHREDATPMLADLTVSNIEAMLETALHVAGAAQALARSVGVAGGSAEYFDDACYSLQRARLAISESAPVTEGARRRLADTSSSLQLIGLGEVLGVLSRLVRGADRAFGRRFSGKGSVQQ